MATKADTCPISTEGLRALVALLDLVQPEKAAERKAKQETSLIDQRLAAAFGKVVYSADVSLELEVIA
jgi:hypothetical protein